VISTSLQQPSRTIRAFANQAKEATMTLRTRVLMLALLAAVIGVSSALAGRSDTGFTVTSSLDGKTVLPIRSQWIVTPPNAQTLSQVDFFIDGYHAWTQHQAPWQYAGGGDWLVTTTLKPGPHTFSIRATTTDDQVATDTVTAQVVAPPPPPAKLRGTWTLKKATNTQRPPLTTFTVTPRGWVFGPNNTLDVQYLPNGNIILYTLIIDRPEQTDPICNGQPQQHQWHIALSPDNKSITLNPVGNDPCRIRLAVVQGTWTHSH
jgi:hypothetical protein